MYNTHIEVRLFANFVRNKKQIIVRCVKYTRIMWYKEIVELDVRLIRVQPIKKEKGQALLLDVNEKLTEIKATPP